MPEVPPAAFGLTNVADACGAVATCTPASYLFWDGIHPTAKGHQILANAMFALAVPEPSTWALTLGGMMLVGWRARARG